MAKEESYYKQTLEGKKIPILTLDNIWHQLFSQTHRTEEIERLEQNLIALLKIQGQTNNDIKKCKALKKKFMDEIVSLADELEKTGDVSAQKKIDENKKLIEECNTKIEELEDSLLDLPRDIDKANKELMLKTMEACYTRLEENHKQIKEYDEWIANVRVELKKNLVRKQEMEVDTYRLYSYMHDIFGPDVIDIFDMYYHPEQYAPKSKKPQEEKNGEVSSQNSSES